MIDGVPLRYWCPPPEIGSVDIRKQLYDNLAKLKLRVAANPHIIPVADNVVRRCKFCGLEIKQNCVAIGDDYYHHLCSVDQETINDKGNRRG